MGLGVEIHGVKETGRFRVVIERKPQNGPGFKGEEIEGPYFRHMFASLGFDAGPLRIF
jgi:hypothetical protein